jgi:peptidyl-prolyl cis-trans isomerase C
MFSAASPSNPVPRVTRTTSFLALFALLSSAAPAQSGSVPTPSAAPAQSSSAPTPSAAPAQAADAIPAAADPVIMTAGDLKVTKSEFESALSTLPPQYRAYATGPQKRRFAEDYLRIKLLAVRGRAEGVDKLPEVQKQLELTRDNVTAGAEARQITAAITVSPEELQQAYEAHKKDYERVKARHILIAPQGSPAARKDIPALTDAEAKAKAESLRAAIVGGADFAELAKKESHDTGSGASGGELGFFTHGQMVPEFDKAAFETKPGEIAPVVKSTFGYHIIQVEEHTYTPFEEVKSNLERTVRQQKADAELAKVVSATNPVFDDAYFPPAPAPSQPQLPAPAPAPAQK